jgi:hypothetical protein
LSQFGVAASCGDQANEHTDLVPRPFVEVGDAVDDRREVAGERAGIGNGDGRELLTASRYGSSHQGCFGGPAAVERGLADSGAGRDLVDAEPVVAEVGQSGESRLNDGPVARRIKRAPAHRPRRRGFTSHAHGVMIRNGSVLSPAEMRIR